MTTSAIPYLETFTIRANEVDSSGKLTLGAIGNLFQEVAGNNALELHFDITDLLKENLTWVVSRMDFHIHRLPKWRETITVETWPAAGDSFRAYRNYRILDEAGEELCTCLSYWMMLSLETRRPVRIPQAVLDAAIKDRDHVAPIKSNRQKQFTEPDVSKEIIVRRSDLDMNNHVNNVRYMEWMLETLPLEQTWDIKNFDIVFLRETFVDVPITTTSKQIDPTSIEFNIIDQDGKVIAMASADLESAR